MKNRNEILKAAFEEAARIEIEKLPAEEKIVRPYSEEFKNKINRILDGEEKEPKKKSGVRFGKIAVVAAVLVAILTFSVSGLIVENFPFKFGNTNYSTSDFEFTSEGAFEDENELRSIVYNGKKVKIRYTYYETDYENENGSVGLDFPEYGLMLYVDGVRQSFDVRHDKGRVRDTDIYTIESDPGKEKSVELSFKPNIGKKGETLSLALVKIYDPDNNFYTKCVDTRGVFVGHWDDDNDRICDKCGVNIDMIPVGGPTACDIFSFNAKLVMEKDAPKQTPVADAFSGMKVSELDERIYHSYDYFDSFDNLHNDFDEMRNLGVKIYKDFDESYHEESYFIEELNQVVTNSEWATRIETEAKTEDDFILNFYGQEGKYRVSFYIGTEIQPVFDGCDYADIEVKKGEQVELAINVDTSKLKEDNHCYVLYTSLDGVWDRFGGMNQGLVHTIGIK
ncbi:MAG: hypothetical protein IJN68_04185 [Clostridia bacterium]|nr:hypothetical protein [Clostridia bacterium]